VSELSELWRISSFRQAVRTLLALDEATLSALRQRSPVDAGPPPSDLAVDAAAWTESAAALRTLYQLAAQMGVTSLVSELAELAGEDQSTNPRLTGLLTWLEPRPEDTEAEATDRALASMLPVLTAASATVDFRMAEVANEGGLRLVPILVVRLTFDEHVAGSDAIVFQISPAELDRVMQELESARTKANDLASQLPKGLVLGASSLKGGHPNEA
jgi:hypothetical protein